MNEKLNLERAVASLGDEHAAVTPRYETVEGRRKAQQSAHMSLELRAETEHGRRVRMHYQGRPD